MNVTPSKLEHDAQADSLHVKKLCSFLFKFQEYCKRFVQEICAQVQLFICFSLAVFANHISHELSKVFFISGAAHNTILEVFDVKCGGQQLSFHYILSLVLGMIVNKELMLCCCTGYTNNCTLSQRRRVN